MTRLSSARSSLPGILAGLACLLLLAHEPRAEQASSIRDVTAAIAQGADSSSRREAIVARLKAIGVEYKLQEFTTKKGWAGTNIVATVKGGPTGVVLIGAHYDRVAVGQGVLDNGDIFGYGNTFFATASQPEGRLARSLRSAAEDSGIAVRLAESARYPLSDHHNMIAAGIETLGIALIDGAEIDAVMAGGQGPPPRVLTIIHTPKDAIDVLNVAEVARGTLAIERLLRVVDSGS